MDYLDGWLASEPVGRTSSSDACGTRPGGADRPVLLLERFTGPCATNSMGKAFFDAADAAPKVHPDILPVKAAANGAIAAAGFTGGGRRLPPCTTFAGCRRSLTASGARFDAMRYSASVGLTTNLDQVCSDAGTASPQPDSFQPRPVPHVRPMDRAPPRGPYHRPPADELSTESERPAAARTERALAEPVSVLRR